LLTREKKMKKTGRDEFPKKKKKPRKREQEEEKIIITPKRQESVGVMID